MDLILKAVLLGIVEGLTEFLPVSSTGHLILVGEYLAFDGAFADLFNIVIQGGAILAVIVYFWKKIFPPLGDQEALKKWFGFWLKVAVAIIPSGVLGVLFVDRIEEVLFNSVAVAVTLVLGALLIIFAENKSKTTTVTDEFQITYKQAILVGLAQCMALIPGMSRSASTIIGGLFVGFSRAVAAEFSFFMSIPTLLGAGLIKLLKSGMALTGLQWTLLGIGTAVSFIVAYFVIAIFMNYIKKHDFKVFAWYRIVLGLVVLAVSFWR